MGEPIRLQKILAYTGCGSRRACEKFIEEGRVTVDGVVVERLGSKADPDTQVVTLDGEKVSGPGRVSKSAREAGDKVYYMLSKPRGVLSTNEDPSGRPLAVQLVREKRRIFCVGRLDKDTEGLLLLTNDGELANQLTHPSFGVQKVYVAQVDGLVSRQQVAKLEHGVHLAEGRTRGARIRVRKRGGHSSVLEMTIFEGMNRQVRRMLAAVGLYCRRLKRVAVGPLRLGGLPDGASRLLTPDELRRLQAAIRTEEERQSESSAAPVPAAQEEEAEEAAPAVQPEQVEQQPAQVAGEEPMDESAEKDWTEEEAEAKVLAQKIEAPPYEDAGDTEGWEDEERQEPESEMEGGDSSLEVPGTKDRGAPEEEISAEDIPPTAAPPGRKSFHKGERKPWERTSDRGAGRPGDKRERPQQRDRKPWQERKSRGEERGERGAKPVRPWEKRERPQQQDRKPWQKREGRGEERGERGAKPVRPWEKRERPQQGERKPWQKRKGRGEERGERGGRPWEKRERPQQGERKPWQERKGPREERGERGGKPVRPWEKRERPQQRDRKPWQQREGPREERGDRGGGRPWEKRERSQRSGGKEST